MITARRPSWTALIGAFGEALEWGLDRAAHFARHYPDEVEAIERVRAHMRGRVANHKSPLELDDMVFAFTLVMGALDSELCRLGAYGSPVRTETIRIPHTNERNRHERDRNHRNLLAAPQRATRAAWSPADSPPQPHGGSQVAGCLT